MPVMMRGPVVCQLCVERKTLFDDRFFSHLSSSRHGWSLLELNIG